MRNRSQPSSSRLRGDAGDLSPQPWVCFLVLLGNGGSGSLDWAVDKLSLKLSPGIPGVYSADTDEDG